MGVGTEEQVVTGGPVGLFRSAGEMREVLDRLLVETDTDPVAGPMLRQSDMPHQLIFSDAGIVLNVTASDAPGHCLQWNFEDSGGFPPALSMEMTCDVANRFLQGRENFAIAMARGRITVSCPKARSALSFLPASRELIRHYRAIVYSDYPHLIV